MNSIQSPNPPPLISIGITCYNAECTIRRALDSALSQDWGHFEVLVVDDGSSDSSVSIVERYAGNHSNIRLVRQPSNCGFPVAINTLLEHAHGDFIAFFDDDDVSRPDRIRRQWERMVQYEAAHSCAGVLCYSNRTVVRDTDVSAGQLVRAIGREGPGPSGDAVFEFLMLLRERGPYVWGQLGSGSIMVRRQFMQACGGFDPAFRRGAEWDFAIRAADLGAHLIAVNEPLLIQHVTTGVGNEKAGRTALRYALQLRQKYRARLRSRRMLLAAYAQAYARYYYAKRRAFRWRAFSMLAAVLAPRLLMGQLFRKSRILSRWWR